MELREHAAHTIKLGKTYGRGETDPIKVAVDALEADICDRRGLKHEWAQISDAVKDDIREMWEEIIRQSLTQRRLEYANV
jgi:hypothetical protein